ncbi:hypothetical protein ABZ402_31385 [Streptomyces mirabilis]|uniref:hypothetical protein n=1 Tax=Streptomyces mirabilis TaxID=68239 RepID=UPI0033D5C930
MVAAARLGDDLRLADLLDVVDDVEDVADGAALVGDGSVVDLLGLARLLGPIGRVLSSLSEEDGTRRTPDLDDCRPNCVNIARTDRDIEDVIVQIKRLRPLVDDPLAPAFRHAREQHELDRLERIVTAHDSTGEPHDGH